MILYVPALKPTDSITCGLLPAAARLGVSVVVLTDEPEAHTVAYAGQRDLVAVEAADVRDAAALAARVLAVAPRHGAPMALLTNSDHLQTATAQAAELLGLAAKDWRAAARCKNKSLTRRTLAEAGLDQVASVEIGPGDDPAALAGDLPFPAVVKPREGVASEDVVLVSGPEELGAQVADIRRRRGASTLVVEEYLTGELHTYETLGDGTRLHHLGSWRTTLGPPPFFTESARDWAPDLPDPVEQHLRAQLGALGVGLGACHTEFVLQGDRARIVEVNYRLIGDTMDLVYAELLGVDLFAELIRVHRGEPLSADLPDPRALDRSARIHYVTAPSGGTLTDAPPPSATRLPDGIRLGHRRLREPGVTAPLHGTNRDYLSVVHAIGPSSAPVRDAVERFVGAQRWAVSA